MSCILRVLKISHSGPDCQTSFKEPTVERDKVCTVRHSDCQMQSVTSTNAKLILIAKPGCSVKMLRGNRKFRERVCDQSRESGQDRGPGHPVDLSRPQLKGKRGRKFGYDPRAEAKFFRIS